MDAADSSAIFDLYGGEEEIELTCDDGCLLSRLATVKMWLYGGGCVFDGYQGGCVFDGYRGGNGPTTITCRRVK